MVQTAMFATDLLTVGKAAKELSVSRWTIYYRVKTGKLLGVSLAGMLFIPMSDIKRYRRHHNNQRP